MSFLFYENFQNLKRFHHNMNQKIITVKTKIKHKIIKIEFFTLSHSQSLALYEKKHRLKLNTGMDRICRISSVIISSWFSTRSYVDSCFTMHTLYNTTIPCSRNITLKYKCFIVKIILAQLSFNSFSFLSYSSVFYVTIKSIGEISRKTSNCFIK